MELRQLRYFVSVAEHGHVTRAAEALHVAQPSVSQALRQLERELGVTLFERTRQGMSLTAAGQQLLPDAAAALRHARRVEDLGRQLARGHTGLLRVGYAPVLDDGLVTRAVLHLRAERPEVVVAIHEVGFTNVTDILRRSEVDLVLYSPPADEPDLEAGPVVHRGQRVVALPAGHRLCERERLQLEDLAGETLPSLGPVTPNWARTWIPSHTPSGQPIHRGPLVETAGELLAGVASGQTLAILPAAVARIYRQDDIVFLPIDLEPYDIVPAWRAGGSTPLIDAFVKALAEVGNTG